MKKLIGIILLVLVFGAIAGWIFRAEVVSFYLSKKVKVPISIDSIEFPDSKIKINGFKIKNPSGYKDPDAYVCDSIEITLNKKDLPSIIERIELKNNYLYIDCDNAVCTTNNWSKLASKIADKEKSKESKSQDVTVKSLYIDHLNVKITGLGLSSNVKNLGMESLEFRNIGGKDGFPIQQIIAVLFKKAGLTDYIKDVFSKDKMFDKYFSPFGAFSENEPVESEEAVL